MNDIKILPIIKITMSNFIHPENQKLLWNTIQKVPLLNANIPTQNQNFWFKQIIGDFYNRNQYKKLNSQELQELNKETIGYMIKQLKNISQPPQPPTQITQPIGELKPNFFAEPASHRIESKSESYSRQFLERQNDYHSMIKKEIPPEPNFQDKIDDVAIDNMEELVKQHLKQRELEVQMFSPPPPIPVSQKQTIGINPSNNENITFDVEVLEQKSVDETSKLDETSKKSVHWSESVDKEDFLELKKDFEKLLENFTRLQNDLEILKQGKKTDMESSPSPISDVNHWQI
jgi:hypothetical protein